MWGLTLMGLVDQLTLSGFIRQEARAPSFLGGYTVVLPLTERRRHAAQRVATLISGLPDHARAATTGAAPARKEHSPCRTLSRSGGFRVTLRAGAAPGDMNRLPLPRPELTFICGIGTGGMTPFEYLLVGRGPGDEICFRVRGPTDMEQFFEHVVLAFCAPFKDRDEVHFQVRLTGIEPADGREIVRPWPS